MLIRRRLREIREARKLSQGDIERRTGLIRHYVSRVESGTHKHHIAGRPLDTEFFLSLTIEIADACQRNKSAPRNWMHELIRFRLER